ncbi:hypothetical protein AR158_C688L [Paramecium bursaria Chlorella virus AR158]|nr:hypothetical protein AR158_C688L [Paramecium bursaria Chlorella virus AR158]ABU44233.1 hypothetical protein AR158_C688L [Paramecium bursaria Chlorella virus AR158]
MINADSYPLLITCWKNLSFESRMTDERQTTIRRVMTFYWFVHVILTALFTIFVIVDMYPNLMSTFLIILQLYIIKIFESLNEMYSKVMNVEMTSISLIEYIQDELFKCIEEKHDHLYRVEHVSSNILCDLREFEIEMKWYILILSSFFWKVPKHSNFITKKDVAKEVFENILKKNVDIF